MGYAPTRGHIINPAHIEDGDLIYLIESSGVHANGITMLRDVALKASNGYMTKLEDGKTFLEHILTPTHIYAPLIAALQRERVDIHYAINITGHGWRKLMRAPKAFTYYIHTVVPPPSPIFSFIQDVGMVRTANMYGDYNMGAGFALVIPKHAKATLEEVLHSNAETFGYSGYEAGIVKSDGGKRVVISPLHLIYEAATLQVR
jgi:phosphoribosylformylglycinamidine cyclo-ligase